MNRFPRFISKQMGSTISAKWLFGRATPVFMPFYHVVSDEKLPHVLNYPYRNVGQFEKELDFFLKHFTPVSLEELVSGEPKQKKVFHLSFDDGLKECAEIIAPILKRKGVPATFFINTGFADNKMLFHKYKASLILNYLNKRPNYEVENLLKKNNLGGKNILKTEFSQVQILNKAAEILGVNFHEFLQKEKPYLTTAHLEQLHADGFSIGGHSHNHPEFYTITVDDQLQQVIKSMEWLNKYINPKIKAFSFPFTDDKVSRKLLLKIKTDGICDVTFGTAGVKFDELDFHFQRYPMEQNGKFIQKLKGEFVYFELRKKIGKATVTH